MRTITGLYDSYDDAIAVVGELESAGIPSENISIVGRGPDQTNTGEAAAAGAGVGALLGGAGGLLAGLATLTVPGIGPVVAAGWLVTTAAGAAAGAAAGGAAGGLLGSLTQAGIDEDSAHIYAEGVRRGSILVSVNAEEDDADIAQSIISDSAPVDLEDRRAMFREEGWNRFDEAVADPAEEEAAKERQRLRDYQQQMP